MNITDVESLMKEYHLDGYTRNGYGSAGVTQDGAKFTVETDGLPNLRFFAALARLAGISIEEINVDSQDHGSGCDTCGYGGGTTYRITFSSDVGRE